jgi:hypothetical protein
MARIITTYIVVLLLVSLGFFGVGAIASAKEMHEPMQSQPDYFYPGSQDYSYR